MPEEHALYGLNPVFIQDPDALVYRANPAGCSVCGVDSGGLKARCGVLEILEFTPEIQEAILDGISPSLLRRSSIANGSFLDLWDDGLRLVKSGVTSLEELELTLRPYITDRIGGRGTSGSPMPNNRPQLPAANNAALLKTQPQL